KLFHVFSEVIMSDNVITFIDGFQPLILFLSLLFLLLYYYSELSKSRAVWKPYQTNLACTLMSRVFYPPQLEHTSR
ncbi:hypothetical protein OFN71_27900, partial [Escherichia coli]|nr:hypothetical protein [Escherichia coli]